MKKVFIMKIHSENEKLKKMYNRQKKHKLHIKMNEIRRIYKSAFNYFREVDYSLVKITNYKINNRLVAGWFYIYKVNSKIFQDPHISIKQTQRKIFYPV